MPWFQNFYHCDRCGHEWADQWSCMCDDDCPACGARHFSPHDSEDLSLIVEPQGRTFVVFSSCESADDQHLYGELGKFSSLEEAYAFVTARLQVR